MFLGFSIWDIIQVPFGWLLSFLYDFTTNYGVALILFAFLVRLILLPATAKGKKSTMKMSRLTPRVQALQKKYENDQKNFHRASDRCTHRFLPRCFCLRGRDYRG